MAQVIEIPGVGEVEFPDDMTDEQIAAVISGNAVKKASDPDAEAKALRQAMTDEMSGPGRFLAGIGMGMTDVAQGIGQAAGLQSREDVAESRALDAALRESTGGAAGNLVGTLATYLPTAFIPGANTLLGAGLIGAGSGFLAPSTDTGETVANTVIGGGLGPLSLLAARAVPAAIQGGNALIEPFTSQGQTNIAARTLADFAGGPEAAAKAAQWLRDSAAAVPGVENTAAEVAGNAGIAQLERVLRLNPQLKQQFTERLQGNREAMLDALRGISKDEGAMENALMRREAVSNTLYGQAYEADVARRAAAIAEAERKALAASGGIHQGVDTAAKNLPNELSTEGIKALAKRPEFKRAIAGAKRLAANKGIDLGDPLESVQGLHYVKLALDDIMDKAKKPGATALGRNEEAALSDMKGLLVDELSNLSGKYGLARETHAAMSKPISQMEIGRELVNRFQPALMDFVTTPETASSTTAATFARALRDMDATAAKATGYKGASMESILTPEQMQTARGVATELAKRATAENLGRSAGSPTAENLVGQNLLRQFLGPTGLPQSMIESTLSQQMARIPKFATSVGEQKVLDRLAQGLLNPKEAATLLELGNRYSIPMRGLDAVEPYIPALALGSMYGAQ